MNIYHPNWRRAFQLFIVLWLSIASAGNAVDLISVADPTLAPSVGGNGDSICPIISADGRYVLFASHANNLAFIGTSNVFSSPYPVLNVYLRDRSNTVTTLISVNLSGNGGGDGDSIPRAISTNGQFLLFESSATNLAPGDTNNASDVFLRDLINNTTRVVSISTNGNPGNGYSQDSVMTPDGRYIAFSSAATNLVANDTNGIADVFVRDTQLNVTALVSAGASWSLASYQTNRSELPEITPDGRYVAFYSTATNLVSGVNSVGQIYVRDLLAGTTLLASTNAQALAQSLFKTTVLSSCSHTISADGNYVAFETTANTSPPAGLILRQNLQTGVTDVISTNANGLSGSYADARNVEMTPDGRFVVFIANGRGSRGTNTALYAWDAQIATNFLVSANLTNGVSPNSACLSPAIDATGNFVVFLSSATNLTAINPGDGFHVYRRNISAAVTELVNVGTGGATALVNPDSSPSVSADARLVAFQSRSQNLVPNDDSHYDDIFIRDLQAGVNELISARLPAVPSLTPSGASILSPACVSTNGRYVVFYSDADNLTHNDTNGFRDVFVRDLVIGTNILVSAATNGVPGNGNSTEPAISADGRFVTYSSTASNLTSGIGFRGDVYLRDLALGTNTLVSMATNGVPGNGASRAPAISRDGRYTSFFSKATSLAPGSYSASTEDVFWRDTTAGTTLRVTTNSGSAAYVRDMTPDGRFVCTGNTLASAPVALWDSNAAAMVFGSNATGAVTTIAISPDGNRMAYGTASGIFVVDRIANTTQLIASQGSASSPRFSGNGQFLAYSTAANQASNDTNGLFDVYIYDLLNGTNLLVSHSFNSVGAGNGNSDSPGISPDGRFVTYRSFASNLVPGDSNGRPDLFLFDRLTDTTTVPSSSRSINSTANFRSFAAFFSDDAQSIVFQSSASDVVGQDFNFNSDLFAFRLYGSSATNSLPDFTSQISLTLNLGSSGPPMLNPGILWTVTPGFSYQVQFKDELSDPNWHVMEGVLTVVGSQGYLIDLAPPAEHRFYRVVSF